MNQISSCKVNFHWGFLSYYKISEYLHLHSVPMLTLNIFMIIFNWFVFVFIWIILANFILFKYFLLYIFLFY